MTECLNWSSPAFPAETGLDYFGAWYFSGAQGRFTTPDWSDKPEPIPYADLPCSSTSGIALLSGTGCYVPGGTWMPQVAADDPSQRQ